MREIILDTETTGLNYKVGDRIIEVGCIELVNHIPTGNNLQFYCSTEKSMDENAIKVHGLTNAFLNEHPTFKENSNKFLEFIRNDDLIIHNANFDTGFINNELKLIGIEPMKNKIIDTVALAKKVLNTRIANLDYLCRRFSIDLSARIMHGALLDCQLLAEVYLELMGGKQTTLEFSRPIKENISRANNKNSLKTKAINKVRISEEEIKSHKKFVKNLKKSFWNKFSY